jgi:hypothetical protein
VEARTAFRGKGISKSSVAVVVAVLVAFVLVAAGGSLAKALSRPVAPATAHIVAGQPGASGYGSAWNYSNLRHGTQSIEGPMPASAPLVMTVRDPGTRRGGSQIAP